MFIHYGKMARIFLIYLTCFFLTGCSGISYYSQSIHGQMSILLKRERLDTVISDKNTESSVKNKLKLVAQIRHFASDELHLPDNQSYLYYVDLKRPYVVWNVFAAPEFSLLAKNWCYPIVGCVSYRGYFAEVDAEKHAKELNQQGFDVSVSGIAAYSTLGWFDDPVLNTMLGWSNHALAGLIFHELSHQVIYISSETEFNEAFSTAVGRLGTIQWLLYKHPEQLDRYLQFLRAYNDFRELLNSTHDELASLYTSSVNENIKRNYKSEIFDSLKIKYHSLKKRWPEGINFDSWFSQPINNARFTSTMTYLQKVPAFLTMFAEEQGKWPKFLARIKEMENLDKKKREQIIEDKLAHSVSMEQLVKLIQNNKNSQ